MAFDDHYFLERAIHAGKQSYCVSKHVGCIAVIDKREILTGVNGTPPGFDNCNQVFSENCDEHNHWTKLHELHAETNMIAYAAKKGISLEGATIYCSHEPCTDCLKILTAIGAKRIVFRTIFLANNANRAARNEYISRCNIPIEHLPETDDHPLG
jgi:dCMP deaminase